jgi:hypothetical protein
MNIYQPNGKPKSNGIFILLYGEMGVGKSTSILQTAPDPIKYIVTEPRDPERWLSAADRPGVRIDFCLYQNWFDLLEFLNKPVLSTWYKGEGEKNPVPVRTIVIDSLSYLMNVSLSNEIIDERIEVTEEKGKKALRKELTDSAKLSLEGYGGLAGQMTRLFNLLGILSQQGYIVICTALLEENPKYNRALKAGPALRGKDFSRNIGSYCDLVGLVDTRYRYDEQNKIYTSEIVYPPFVHFEGDGSFLCKLTGTKLRGYSPVPLDIEKIIKFS